MVDKLEILFMGNDESNDIGKLLNMCVEESKNDNPEIHECMDYMFRDVCITAITDKSAPKDIQFVLLLMMCCYQQRYANIVSNYTDRKERFDLFIDHVRRQFVVWLYNKITDSPAHKCIGVQYLTLIEFGIQMRCDYVQIIPIL
jgi:hypothetical protein